MPESEFSVQGSHGRMICNPDGTIKSIDHEQEWTGEYDNIAKFDVDEYLRYNGELDHTDICLIGYWTKDGKYEPPEQDFRDALDNDFGSEGFKAERLKRLDKYLEQLLSIK